MPTSTNSLVERMKKLAVPAGIVSTLLFASAFLLDYNRAHAAAAAAGPLDESSVSALVSLDNAVEAVSARVTPAVVNVAVTSRVSPDDQGDGEGQGHGNGQGFGGINPQDLPPGFRQFFFGQGGQGMQMKPQPQIEHGVGSGVIISPDGYIVTNDHVVNGATQVRVTLDDRRVFPAKVIGVDKLNDIAVIKIDAHNLPSVPWGDSAKLRTGETVLAFGNPFGNFPFTVTRGIVSGLDRPNPYRDDPRKPGAFIQTDAAINPGNSGGPLLNSKGEVIGINTAIEASGNGVGFAVPINTAKSVMPDLLKGGAVKTAWLGIEGMAISKDMAAKLSLPADKGVYVVGVIAGSPAEKAGLVQGGKNAQDEPTSGGDIITAVDNVQVSKVEDMLAYFNGKRPGEQVTLTVIRGSNTISVPAALGEWPEQLSVSYQQNQDQGGNNFDFGPFQFRWR